MEFWGTKRDISSTLSQHEKTASISLNSLILATQNSYQMSRKTSIHAYKGRILSPKKLLQKSNPNKINKKDDPKVVL